MTTFSVAGVWQRTAERWLQPYQAATARTAEGLAQLQAGDENDVLLVCRVLTGDVRAADRYTAFVDPDDPRNLDRTDLEPDVPVLDGDPEWTVFGLAAPKGTALSDPALPGTGERYGDVINATSAGAAEDVARSRLADKGGVLFVCCVLAGRVAAADTYATFADPDVRAR